MKIKYNKNEKAYKITDEYLEWECRIVDAAPRKCLVIMPIGLKRTMEYRNNMLVFAKIVKPCVEKSGYNFECYHADLIDKSGNISRQIFEGLKDDDLVIADLRRNNVNVVYELGVRHTLGKRSILICSDHSENFFHSKQYRAVKYNIDGSSNKEFYTRIKNQIKEIVENPEKYDNPVADIISIVKKLTFNPQLGIYTDEEGGRFCTNCYENERLAKRVVFMEGFTYHCLRCDAKYIDLDKKKEWNEKRRVHNQESIFKGTRSGWGR